MFSVHTHHKIKLNNIALNINGSYEGQQFIVCLNPRVKYFCDEQPIYNSIINFEMVLHEIGLW